MKRTKVHAFLVPRHLNTHMSNKSIIKSIAKHPKTHEFIRFAIVGTIATGIHYGIYMLLVWMNDIGEDEKLYTNISYSIGYVISWLCNFYLSAHFTFREKTSVKRGIGFALSHGVNYLLHLIFLNFFLWLGVSEAWAPIPVFCIVIPINFLLVRFVFKSKHFQN